MNPEYKVIVDAFEGPLDLLLHLINKLEIDIYDIPVATITGQYMNYIQTMKKIELNIASEYLVMAATLLALKSEMLLPKQETFDQDDTYIEDPRDDLIHRLIEYRKYKDVANELKEQELSENKVYTRLPVQLESTDKVEKRTGDVSIYDMIGALQRVFQRKEWNAPLETRVNRIEVSIEEKMTHILRMIKETNEKVSFEDLFTKPDRTHIVTTFLAILQLMKDNQLICQQEGYLEPIFIYIMEE